MEQLKKTSLALVTCLLAACAPFGFHTSSSNSTGDRNGTSNTDTPGSPGGPSDPGSPGGPTSQIDWITEVAEPMGKAVDNQYSAYRELMAVRTSAKSFAVDTCDPEIQGKNRFADRIAYAVSKFVTPARIDIGAGIAPLFNLNANNSTYLPTGLLSHPFCRVTLETLTETFENYRVPDATVIAKAQKFTDLLNQFRNEARAGSRDGQVKAYRLWSKFMMCLGYMESLTTANSQAADSIASSFGFNRPPGVSFYNDPNQSAADSVLAIGIFQLSNVVKWGDSYSCVMDWNRQFPSCRIDPDISKKDMVPILGSARQTFNAYCGVSVVARMFGVQVNATKAKNTHPDNVLASGALKAPGDRCVTPFMNVNKSYNHYAPLQNGSGFTLNNILSCTLAD